MFIPKINTFNICVIISSVFDLKNIILLLLSKLLSNSEICLFICTGSTLIDSEFLPNSDSTRGK